MLTIHNEQGRQCPYFHGDSVEEQEVRRVVREGCRRTQVTRDLTEVKQQAMEIPGETAFQAKELTSTKIWKCLHVHRRKKRKVTKIREEASGFQGDF